MSTEIVPALEGDIQAQADELARIAAQQRADSAKVEEFERAAKAPIVKYETEADAREAFARLAQAKQARQAAMALEASIETPEQRERRARREADVTEAARRSQTEIRRHVDAYLKEHFEGLVRQVTAAVVVQTAERLAEGIAAVQEHNSIAVDRMEARIRQQLEAFVDAAYGRRKPPAVRKAQKGRRR